MGIAKVDAELRNASFFKGSHDAVGGFIFNDSKGRFPDGYWVFTSRIEAQRPEPETGALIVKTRNSTYRVYRPGQHVLERHEGCQITHCNICEGGLANCIVCGGAEASMPTICPGRRLSHEELDAIQAGDLDFTDVTAIG